MSNTSIYSLFLYNTHITNSALENIDCITLRYIFQMQNHNAILFLCVFCENVSLSLLPLFLLSSSDKSFYPNKVTREHASLPSYNDFETSRTLS